MNARIAKVFIGIEDPYLVFTLPRNAEAVKKVDNTLAELAWQGTGTWQGITWQGTGTWQGIIIESVTL